MLVKRGSSAVKIYRDRKSQGTYYRVVYHLGGRRHRLNFRDFQTARSEAEAKASQLSQGHLDAALLRPNDRLEYGRAKHAVKELGLPLDAVAIEYAQARDLLDGVPLLDAARFYARHHGKGIKRIEVAAAVSEMLERKKQKGVSDVYLRDLRYRLSRFSRAFQCSLGALSPDDVANFFFHLGLSPRSHNNYLRTLRTFFCFAQKHDWLSKEADLLSRVEKRHERRAPVDIFSHKEAAALLKAASPLLAPCIALSAFAGLRTEEVLRLEWTDLSRRPGFIEVAAHKAKTATRRIVPLLENLSKWLALAPHNGERVWPHTRDQYFSCLSDAARVLSGKWPRNVLRHSFISYRLAEIQDVNRLALEAGNSPQMIFRHYRELATPDQAQSWFAIAPTGVPKVVPFTAGRSKADLSFLCEEISPNEH
jgi:integrase